MKKITTFFLALTLSCIAVYSQSPPPVIAEVKNIGGSANDSACGSIVTPDGGYIIFGRTESEDDDAPNNFGKYDAYAIKFNSAGTKVWGNTFGGSQNEIFNNGIPLSGGGYAFVGYTFTANDSDQVKGKHGGGSTSDIWFVKTDAQGNLTQQKCVGGSANDIGVGLAELANGGILIFGNTYSDDFEVSENFGGSDMWLVALDANAEKAWDLSYGGSGDDAINDIYDSGTETSIAGKTNSLDFGYYYSTGGNDGVFLKIQNSNGLQLGLTIFGSTSDDEFISIIADGSMLLLNGITSDAGTEDFWSARIDNSGNLYWQNLQGGSGSDQLNGGCFKGPFVFTVGSTNSNDGVFVNNHGGTDGFIDKRVFQEYEQGALEWQMLVGGSGDDAIVSITDLGSGSYRVVMNSNSTDGDLAGGNPKGGSDIVIVRLEGDFPTNGDNIIDEQSINVYPNPVADVATISFGNIAPEEYAIVNMSGQTVLWGNVVPGTQNITVNCNDLSTGTYFICLSIDEEIITKEIIVQK